MKFEHDNKMLKIAVYAFLVLAAAIVFNLILQQIGAIFGWVNKLISFVTPAFYGFVFAFLLNPLIHFFDDRFLPRLFKKIKPSVKRGLSILCTYLSALTVIILFLALVVPQLIYSMVGIGANVPSYLKSLQALYFSVSDSIMGMQILEDNQSSEMLRIVFGYAVSAFESMLEGLGGWLTRDFLDKVVGIASSFTSGVLDVILGIIISIYFLADRERLFAQLRKTCAAFLSDDTTDIFHELAMDANRVFNGFIVGKIIDSLIIGILCFIGMAILQLPYAVLISVIVGVTNVIPYFGPFIGAIPGFFLVLISSPDKGPMQSLLFLVFILVLQQFDGNILGPKILGDTTGLSALWVIISIMLFSGMLGVTGMFVGVPLFAVLYALLKRIINHVLRGKGLSTETEDYASNKSPLIK